MDIGGRKWLRLILFLLVNGYGVVFEVNSPVSLLDEF